MHSARNSCAGRSSEAKESDMLPLLLRGTDTERRKVYIGFREEGWTPHNGCGPEAAYELGKAIVAALAAEAGDDHEHTQ